MSSWRWTALLDFGLAVFQVFLAVWFWNVFSFMNLASGAVCATLGMFCLRKDAQQRASRAEEARIQRIRDNWRWN